VGVAVKVHHLVQNHDHHVYPDEALRMKKPLQMVQLVCV
jgi:hypothetical protein